MNNKLNPHEILLEGIRLTRENLLFCAPLMLISLANSLLPIAYRSFTGDTLANSVVNNIATTAMILSVMLHFGLSRIAIETARGRPASWDMFLLPSSIYIQILVVGIVCCAAIFAGFMFLIIPGIVLALMWSQVYCLLVDQRASWFQAVSLSQTLTDGNKTQLLQLFSRLFVISIPILVLGMLIMSLSYPDISNLPEGADPEPIHTPLIDTLNILYSFIAVILQTFNTFVGGITYQKLLQGNHQQTDNNALMA